MSIDHHRVDVQHSSKGSTVNLTTLQSRTVRNSDYNSSNEKSNVKTMSSPSLPFSNKALVSSPRLSQPKQSRNLGGSSSVLVHSATQTKSSTLHVVAGASKNPPPGYSPKQQVPKHDQGFRRTATTSEKRNHDYIKGSVKSPPVIGPRPDPQAGILGSPPTGMYLRRYQAAAMPPFVNYYSPSAYFSMQPQVNIGHQTRPRASSNPHTGSKGKFSKVEGEKNDKQETKETTRRFVGQSSSLREVPSTTSLYPKKSTTSMSIKDLVINSNASIQKKDLTGKEKSKTGDERMKDNSDNSEDYYPFPEHLINVDDYN